MSKQERRRFSREFKLSAVNRVEAGESVPRRWRWWSARRFRAGSSRGCLFGRSPVG